MGPKGVFTEHSQFVISAALLQFADVMEECIGDPSVSEHNRKDFEDDLERAWFLMATVFRPIKRPTIRARAHEDA